MRVDGLRIEEGSSVSNLTVPSGTSFPVGPDNPPNDGELFRRTDLYKVFMYQQGVWKRIIDIPEDQEVYTQDETDTIAEAKASAIVNQAPETTSTINALAALLASDPDGATAMNALIGTKVAKGGDTMTGVLKAPGFEMVSARASKEEISDYDQSALSLINETKIVNFRYKEGDDREMKVGFIADDTHPLLSGENQNCMVVISCIGMLMKAVQELSQDVERLKK